MVQITFGARLVLLVLLAVGHLHAAVNALANPDPILGKTAVLRLEGDSGGAGVTYQWSTTEAPSGAIATLHSPAMLETSVAFTAAGRYRFVCERSEPNGNRMKTKSYKLKLEVSSTFTTVTVAPAGAQIAAGGQVAFSAEGQDQFGKPLAPQPTWTWTVSGGGTISDQGLFSAAASGGAGAHVVTASSRGVAGSTTVTVSKLRPTVVWAPPGPLVYGTPVSANELAASASVAGTFAYTPATGTVLPAGQHLLSAQFTPTDVAQYDSVALDVPLTVTQAVPVISWTPPVPIPAGTALSGVELSATTTVTGTFSYAPAAGTVLTTGTNTLTVAFQPDDAANYTAASASVAIEVLPIAAAPTADVAVGVHHLPLLVILGCVTPGATVHYAIGATVPDQASPAAALPVMIDVSTTIVARSFAPGYAPSEPVTFAWELVPEAVVASPGAGTHPRPLTVTLTCPTPGTAIHYRLDGVAPGPTDPVTTAPLVLSANAVVAARALRVGWTPGPVTTTTYTISADPIITIQEPAADAVVTAMPVVVRFTVTSPEPIDEIRLDGVLIARNPSQPFVGAVSRTYVDGVRTVTVGVTNVSGASASAQRTFIVDAQPPEVVILTPLDNQVVASENVHVTARIDSVAATVTIGGQPAAMTGFIANGWVRLASGANSIPVVATVGTRSGIDTVLVTLTLPTGYDPIADADGDGIPNRDDLYPQDPRNGTDGDEDNAGNGDDVDDGNPNVQSHVVLSSPAAGLTISTGYPQ